MPYIQFCNSDVNLYSKNYSNYGDLAKSVSSWFWNLNDFFEKKSSKKGVKALSGHYLFISYGKILSCIT